MNNQLFFITGHSGSGKTTFLGNLVQELKKYGIQTSGFLAEGFWENNIRSYFELVSAISAERNLFCTRVHHTNWEKVGHFYINQSAITFGEKELDPDYLVQFPVCAIDEVGLFELQGKGWARAINKISENLPDMPMIWTVRETLVLKVICHFNIENYNHIIIKQNQLSKLTFEIFDFLKTRKPSRG